MTIITDIQQQPDGSWTATITNGCISPVHITGFETSQIAKERADEWIKELKKEN